MRAVLLALALFLLGCDKPQEAAAPVVEAALAPAQVIATDILTPLVVGTQQIVQEALPPPSQEECRPVVDVDAAALIVRWEVTSPKAYERKYRRPIWPGGASGVTWGVGYDGGHQTKTTIGRDWSSHPHVTSMQQTSGITGQAAKALTPKMQHIDVPFSHANRVFACSTLPVYRAAARRALGSGFDELTPKASGSLVSLGYNRGWSFKGERRKEMRTIRDECVPARDADCIARELVSMCRLWEGTPNGNGLCARRKDEARLAVR